MPPGRLGHKALGHKALALVLAAGGVLLCGCQRHRPERADAARREIQHDLLQGSLAQALRLARSGERDWRDRPQSDAYIRFELLEAEVLLKQLHAQQAAELLVHLRPPEGALLDSERRVKLASAFFQLGKRAAAQTELERALQYAKASGDKELSVQAAIVGLLFVPPAQIEHGLEMTRTNVELAEELHDPFSRAALWTNLSRLLIRRAEYDRALPYLEKAHAAAEDVGARLLDAVILSNLSACHYKLGDLDTALRLSNGAIALEEKMNATAFLKYAYGDLGNIYFLKDDLPHAVVSYQRALDISEKNGALEGTAWWAGNLATAYADLHEWDRALEWNRKSQALARQNHDESFGPYLDLNAAEIADGRGNRAEALKLYTALLDGTGSPTLGVVWEADARLGGLYAAQGDRARAREYFERALASIEDRRSGLLENDYKITFLSDLIRFYRDYVDLLIDQGDTGKALAVADSSRARMLAARLASRDAGPGGKTPDFTALAKSSHAVLLSYWIAPQRSVVWAISRDGVAQMFPLPADAATIRRLVEAYTARIEGGVGDPLGDRSETGSELYRVLIQPAARLIPPGSRVIIVPDGPLANLNFETLLTPGDHPHYWIEDATVSVAPSLGVLAERVLAERTEPHTRGRGLLLFGSAKPVPPYPALPYADQEIAAIRAHFPLVTTEFAGAAATPAAYRDARPEQFSLIQFSAHAEVNRERPLDSAVILSPVGDDYKLYARAVFGMPLHADLVTVSACQSAGANSYAGEGLVGFAWAFLHAGAKSVIAGLWDVDDQSTAQLMDKLYAGLAAGQPPEQALRRAKLDMLSTTGPFRKPAYWAPFQLYRRVP